MNTQSGLNLTQNLHDFVVLYIVNCGTAGQAFRFFYYRMKIPLLQFVDKFYLHNTYTCVRYNEAAIKRLH